MATRGNGMTSKQILAAPKESVYIWVSRRSLSYAKELAHYLGRQDLRIETPPFLENGMMRGLHVSGITIDHACRLTDKQRMKLYEWKRHGGNVSGLEDVL